MSERQFTARTINVSRELWERFVSEHLIGGGIGSAAVYVPYGDPPVWWAEYLAARAEPETAHLPNYEWKDILWKKQLQTFNNEDQNFRPRVTHPRHPIWGLATRE